MKATAFAASLAALLIMAGCQSEEQAPAKEEPAAAEAQKEEGPMPGDPVKEGEEVAVLETGKGRIVLRFFPNKAPKHVESFKNLVKKGFYDGTKFHRTIEGFMIQGGDPNSKSGDPSTWGQGGPGYNLQAEFNNIRHKRGILSAARSSDPDSAGSQFFIVVSDTNQAGGPWDQLDGQYTVFGEAVAGMEVVDQIVKSPLIGDNGQVDPKEAVPIKSARIALWPLKD
jgi:peptidyl-prolyl cis-trans isomerase B (cyclophilin B)